MNGEMKTAAMSELANACAESHEIVTGYVGGSLDERIADVINLVFVEAEAVAAGILFGAFVSGILDDVLEVVSSEFVELFEHGGGLFLV